MFRKFIAYLYEKYCIPEGYARTKELVQNQLNLFYVREGEPTLDTNRAFLKQCDTIAKLPAFDELIKWLQKKQANDTINSTTDEDGLNACRYAIWAYDNLHDIVNKYSRQWEDLSRPSDDFDSHSVI